MIERRWEAVYLGNASTSAQDWGQCSTFEGQIDSLGRAFTIKRGELKAIRVGGQFRITQEELNRYLQK
jgi:hypothetical protein